MDSIISTFHIDWKIIIAQAVNFAIVFVVLYIYALKPLNKLMAERAEKIAKGITDAKQNAETLNKTKKEQEEILAKVRIEAQNIYKTGKKEGEHERAQLIEKGKLEFTTMIESGKKALESEKIKMVEDARREIASLAMLATEKLLSEKVQPSFNEKAVNDIKHL